VLSMFGLSTLLQNTVAERSGRAQVGPPADPFRAQTSWPPCEFRVLRNRVQSTVDEAHLRMSGAARAAGSTGRMMPLISRSRMPLPPPEQHTQCV